jgi:hypothetical protein
MVSQVRLIGEPMRMQNSVTCIQPITQRAPTVGSRPTLNAPATSAPGLGASRSLLALLPVTTIQTNLRPSCALSGAYMPQYHRTHWTHFIANALCKEAGDGGLGRRARCVGDVTTPGRPRANV